MLTPASHVLGVWHSLGEFLSSVLVRERLVKKNSVICDSDDGTWPTGHPFQFSSTHLIINLIFTYYRSLYLIYIACLLMLLHCQQCCACLHSRKVTSLLCKQPSTPTPVEKRGKSRKRTQIFALYIQCRWFLGWCFKVCTWVPVFLLWYYPDSAMSTTTPLSFVLPNCFPKLTLQPLPWESPHLRDVDPSPLWSVGMIVGSGDQGWKEVALRWLGKLRQAHKLLPRYQCVMMAQSVFDDKQNAIHISAHYSTP